MNSLAPILLRLGVTLEKKFNACIEERIRLLFGLPRLLHQKVHSCLYFSERVRYLFSSGRWAHHAHLKFSFSVAHTLTAERAARQRILSFFVSGELLGEFLRNHISNRHCAFLPPSAQLFSAQGREHLNKQINSELFYDQKRTKFIK
jgi:hypothetical protein